MARQQLRLRDRHRGGRRGQCLRDRVQLAAHQWPDYATIKYESDGDIAWTQNVVDGAARYNGPANRNDRALAIALNAVGACVTGCSQGSSSGPDYATVMYDRATGSPIVTASDYTGPGAKH